MSSEIEQRFHPNGQLESETPTVNGRIHGLQRIWHPNGQLECEATYENGIKNGVVKKWAPDGRFLGEYVMDHGSGIVKMWHANGVQTGEIPLLKGLPNGCQKTWYEDGKAVPDNYFIRGKKVSRKKYFEVCKTDLELPRYPEPKWPVSRKKEQPAIKSSRPARTGSCSIVTDGTEKHRLEFTSRDFALLSGPHFEEGLRFISALGIFDHLTVAKGIPQGATVTRPRWRIFSAAQQLLAVVRRDEDLLQYDYKYSFSGRSGRPRSGNENGFKVRGFFGSIDASRRGYCYLNLHQVSGDGRGRLAEYYDMRIRETIETDELGTLKIHRKKAEMHWLEILPPLIEFVRTRTVKVLEIEHYD